MTLQLHVAINGRPEWSGRAAVPTTAGDDGPLPNLATARDRLRAMRAADGLAGTIEVLVHAGQYELRESLVFGEADLGDERTATTYRAAGDGEVRLVGGLRLRGFVPHGGKVLKLDLAAAGYAGLRFRQLLVAGERQPVARYPNAEPGNPYAGWLTVEGGPVSMYEDGHGRRDRFICRDPRLHQWAAIPEIELFILPRYNWHSDTVPLQSYNPATGEVVLARAAVWEIYPGDRFYFRNVREELDAPGEWYLDAAAETLYFCPPESGADPSTVEVEVPLVEHLLVIDGPPASAPIEAQQVDMSGKWLDDGDEWRDRDEQLRSMLDPRGTTRGFLTFQGLTLTGSKSAGVVIRHVRECALVGCTIRATGAAGVMIRGGANCRVVDCDISDTGGTGIGIWGGLRWQYSGDYQRCNHEARNNYIHHVGAEAKHVAGISLTGQGITVAHNLIHDIPRSGIFSRGNDHLLEFNHIRHVNIETSDCGAIYLCDRDFTMRGTKIRYNWLHDTLGYHRTDRGWVTPAFTFGIYLDDWTSRVEIVGNLIYRSARAGIFIHAGQGNLIENNIVINAGEEVLLFTRWTPQMELDYCGTYDQQLRRNICRGNVLVAIGGATPLYRFGHVADSADHLELATNRWERNLVWHGAVPPEIRHDLPRPREPEMLSWAAWQALGHDAGSIVGDPRFVDATADDFRLADESPALTLGFVPLPLDRMGPQPSATRASWPIVEAPGVRERLSRPRLT